MMTTMLRDELNVGRWVHRCCSAVSVRQMAVSASDVGEERELRELFRRTAGEDLEVDPYELRTILDSNFKHGTCTVRVAR